MAVQEHSPLVLIPHEQTPPDEVLMSGSSQEPPVLSMPFSDIFPPGLRHQDVLGHLGNAVRPPSDSPFGNIARGIMSYRGGFYQQEEENGWIRTEETRQGLALTLLQSHLAHSIDNDYYSLLAAGLSPDQTMSLIGQYILEQEEQAIDAYDGQRGSLTLELAEHDRGDAPPAPTEIDGLPVIDTDALLLAIGEIPPSEETKHEARKVFLEETIRTLKHRIERVKFERLSAIAILELSKEVTA